MPPKDNIAITAKDALTTSPAQPETVTLTVSNITNIVDQAVSQALARFQTTAPASTPAPAGPRRRLTNRDFAMMNTGKGRQTQEDVVAIASSVGPVTHEAGFIPHPPEDVASKDFTEHKTLIDLVEEFGYVVSLDRVEFRARWEPTKLEYRGDHQVKVRILPVPDEPQEARPLLEQLFNTEPRFSRIWIERWIKGKPVTGDRQIDALAAEDAHQSLVARQRDLELTRVETSVATPGGLDYLDNLGTGKVAAIG